MTGGPTARRNNAVCVAPDSEMSHQSQIKRTKVRVVSHPEMKMSGNLRDIGDTSRE
jgi:hypothetical protein